MNARKWTGVVAVLLVSGLLFGCGSSGDSASSEPSTGKLTLAVTDAPVDVAEALYLTITSVTLQGVEGSQDQGPYEVTAAPINLMAYTGEDSKVVLSDLVVPAGKYKVRLDIDMKLYPDDEEQGSWIAFATEAPECLRPLPEGAIESEDGKTCRYPLTIPSGEQTGFKPKGEVTISPAGLSQFTVEFDLRKNVVDPQSSQEIAYVLKPTGLRLVDNATAGTISGSIDSLVFTSTCTPTDAKVRLYDSSGEEVTSVGVTGDDPGPYNYLIGFVPEGTYTVTLRCDLESGREDLASAPGVAVTPGQNTVQDLPLP